MITVNKLEELVDMIKSTHNDDSSGSENTDSIIIHLKECSKCKKKLKFLINNDNNFYNNDKHIFNNQSSTLNQDKENREDYIYKIQEKSNQSIKNSLEKTNSSEIKSSSNEDQYFNIFESDIKNILLVILVGIAIIFLLDIFNRSNSY